MAYKQNTPEQNKKFFDGIDYAIWIKLAYDKQFSDEELVYLNNLDKERQSCDKISKYEH
jgi:hypothetical protein